MYHLDGESGASTGWSTLKTRRRSANATGGAFRRREGMSGRYSEIFGLGERLAMYSEFGSFF